MNRLKKQAWDWCSRYIRLRDAIEYCKSQGVDIYNVRLENLIVACCCCGDVKFWKNMDAGHYFSRGLRGGSGVYFDERNINTQCKLCNGLGKSSQEAYRRFMLSKYSQKVLDELEFKHNSGHKFSTIELESFKQLYKGAYEGLIEGLKLGGGVVTSGCVPNVEGQSI